jgi:hypothetical protein
MASSRETIALTSGEEVIIARQAVRRKAIELGFSLVDQTKVVTAASELARNTVHHGGGGVMTIETLQEGPRSGLALTFIDHGPEIAAAFAPLLYQLHAGTRHDDCHHPMEVNTTLRVPVVERVVTSAVEAAEPAARARGVRLDPRRHQPSSWRSGAAASNRHESPHERDPVQ